MFGSWVWVGVASRLGRVGDGAWRCLGGAVRVPWTGRLLPQRRVQHSGRGVGLGAVGLGGESDGSSWQCSIVLWAARSELLPGWQ